MKWTLFAPFLAIFISTVASASQEKVLKSKTAKVYETPSEKTVVLDTFSQGDVVKMSNEPKDHWYKVLLPTPKGDKKFGWVHEKHFTDGVDQKELKEAGIDRAKKPPVEPTRNLWTLGLTLDASFLSNETNVTFPSEGNLGYLYGIEAGFRPLSRLTILTRLGGHRYSPYSITGYDVMVGADVAFIHYLPWKLSLAVLGGYSLATHAAGIIKSAIVTSDSFNAPDVLGKLVFRYYFNQHFCILAEGGWRYFVKKNVVMGGKNVDFDLTAPFAGLGIQTDF